MLRVLEPEKNIYPEFDVSRLPPGHLMLEASAGTGKTYSIERIYAHLIQAGYNPSEILLVTFTEKATGELADRIRLLLHEKVQNEPGGIYARALTELAGAPIQTIHSFCQRTLESFAFECQYALRQEIADDSRILERQLHILLEMDWLDGLPELRQYVLRASDLLRFSYGRSMSQKVQSATSLWHVDQVGIRLQPDLRTEDQIHLSNPALYLNAGIINIFKQLRAVLPDPALLFEDSAHEKLPLLVNFLKAGLRAMDRTQNTAPLDMEMLVWLNQEIQANPQLFWPNLRIFSDQLLSGKNKRNKELSCVWPALLHWALQMDRVCLVALVPALRMQADRYKQGRGQVGYDDMLVGLQTALQKPQSGPRLLHALRKQYRVAIVDEFQDTDRIQWDIFRRIFFELNPEDSQNKIEGTRHSNSNQLNRPVRLIVVGDPKQAIYGFRGAELRAYLEARSAFQKLHSLEHPSIFQLYTSYRSDPRLLDVLNTIFTSACGNLLNFAQGKSDTESDAYLDYTALRAAPAELRKIRLANDCSAYAPVTLFQYDFTPRGNTAPSAALRSWIPRAIVARIQQLMHDPELLLLEGRGANPLKRRLCFRDICVLVRQKKDAAYLERLLARFEIPFAYYKRKGLYESREALEIEVMLVAIDRPEDQQMQDRARLTSFWPASQDYDDKYFQALCRLAHKRAWAEFFATLLFAGPARQPQPDDGSMYTRRISNYRQILEELTEKAYGARLDLAALVAELSRMRNKPGDLAEEIDIQRQADAQDRVQIMTIHTAKGLEFPVVFLCGGYSRKSDYDLLHYYASGPEGGQRVLDFAGDLQAREQAAAELAAEDQRLLYVALTRAALFLHLPYVYDTSQKGAYMKRPGTTGLSVQPLGPALGRVLASGECDGLYCEPVQNFVQKHLNRKMQSVRIKKSSSKKIISNIVAPKNFQNTTKLTLDLNRRNSRLLSYTAIKHALHMGHAPVQNALFDDGRTKDYGLSADLSEPLPPELQTLVDDGPLWTYLLDSQPEPIAKDSTTRYAPVNIPRAFGGIPAGYVLHTALEFLNYADFKGLATHNLNPLELPDSAYRIVESALLSFGFEPARNYFKDSGESLQQQELDLDLMTCVVRLISGCLNHSLNPIPGAANWQLHQLTLPGSASPNNIREFRFYFEADEIASLWQGGTPPRVHDVLEGSIDLFFRIGERYFIADWKSNHIAAGYDCDNIDAKIEEMQYDLQARIYALAAERWLQKRFGAAYHRELHFGGVYIFFLRGMGGQDTTHGVRMYQPAELLDFQTHNDTLSKSGT